MRINHRQDDSALTAVPADPSRLISTRTRSALLSRRLIHPRQLTNLSDGGRSTAMVSLEIRRHAERESEEGSGSVLSAAGLPPGPGARRRRGAVALRLRR